MGWQLGTRGKWSLACGSWSLIKWDPSSVLWCDALFSSILFFSFLLFSFLVWSVLFLCFSAFLSCNVLCWNVIVVAVLYNPLICFVISAEPIQTCSDVNSCDKHHVAFVSESAVYTIRSDTMTIYSWSFIFSCSNLWLRFCYWRWYWRLCLRATRESLEAPLRKHALLWKTYKS